MRTKTLSTITGFALLLNAGALLGAEGEKEQRGQLSEKDYKFVSEAARGGMAEVELGQLAKQKATDQNIRSFGEKMMADHKKANEELKQIVARKGAVLPATLSHHENSTIEKLQKATGADFDKEYAAAMVKDHKTDVKEFEKAAQSSDDPDIKAFAQKILPTLQEHLRMAEQNESMVKK